MLSGALQMEPSACDVVYCTCLSGRSHVVSGERSIVDCKPVLWRAHVTEAVQCDSVGPERGGEGREDDPTLSPNHLRNTPWSPTPSSESEPTLLNRMPSSSPPHNHRQSYPTIVSPPAISSSLCHYHRYNDKLNSSTSC